MSSDSAEELVLAPLDAANLEALGAASPLYQGKRKISSSAWSSKTTATTVDSLDSSSSIEIPEVMRSEESFVFLDCTKSLPKPYSHLNNAEILIGPICRSESSATEKLDSWRDVTDRHILEVEEEVWNEKEEVHEFKQRRGIQYVFLGLDTQRDLEANCKIELQPCDWR